MALAAPYSRSSGMGCDGEGAGPVLGEGQELVGLFRHGGRNRNAVSGDGVRY